MITFEDLLTAIAGGTVTVTALFFMYVLFKLIETATSRRRKNNGNSLS